MACRFHIQNGSLFRKGEEEEEEEQEQEEEEEAERRGKKSRLAREERSDQERQEEKRGNNFDSMIHRKFKYEAVDNFVSCACREKEKMLFLNQLSKETNNESDCTDEIICLGDFNTALSRRHFK
ncbi:hypothetical protein ElyMa_005605700 [Elysia marginata]|uniref:Endonuclease/exonuclease/phosphatase domain-containing protein n=1 Tax=Elysia marginata TaxID=1093978 RepID=A0AAV4F7B0_9GAST|nr:hypothetical protein ElyMa_005605700 [Elysia marginata]